MHKELGHRGHKFWGFRVNLCKLVFVNEENLEFVSSSSVFAACGRCEMF